MGVSNYKVADLAALAKASSVAPSVNQVSDGHRVSMHHCKVFGAEQS